MTDHRWKKDRNGVESCERDGCMVRRGAGLWQRAKRGHWRSIFGDPIPPCAGKEAGEVKPAPSPLEVVGSTMQKGVVGVNIEPWEFAAAMNALATLEEAIRADATRFYREREAYFAGVFKVADSGQFRADWEGAVKRWEDSIRADELAMAITLAEDDANNHPLVSTSMRLRVRLSKLRGKAESLEKWEASIRKDAMEQAACKVEAQGRQWGILRSMKMTNFADAAQQLADMLRGK